MPAGKQSRTLLRRRISAARKEGRARQARKPAKGIGHGNRCVQLNVIKAVVSGIRGRTGACDFLIPAIKETCGCAPSLTLGQERLHHAAMHVGEAVIAAIVTPRKALVIESQLMKHRGVEVVHVNFVHNGTVPPFVRFAMRMA